MKVSRADGLTAMTAVEKCCDRSAVDCGDSANGRGTGAGALREIVRQFTVPFAGGFRDCSLGGHPFFNGAPSIITLVGLHLPLHSVAKSFAREWLSNG